MEMIRKSTVHALAVVGFIAVVFGGMALATYSARFVPSAVNGIGAAAVSLVQIFVPAGNEVEVVQNTTPLEDTISFPSPSSVATTTEEVTEVSTPSKTLTKGTETTSSTRVGGGSPVTAPQVGGVPDLVPSVLAVGLMTGTTTDSFVLATTTLKSTSRIGVKFVVQNKGTGVTGDWRFTIILPTDPIHVYESTPQQSLLPGERIEYVLGYDRSKWGNDLQISLTVDPQKVVAESVEDNNSAFFKLNVER
jgi:hypothetical protein